MVGGNFVGPTTSSNATLTVLPTPTGRLVGHWLPGTATIADVSGYEPAGTHDGFFFNTNGSVNNAWFTNDVPPIATGGQSLYFATNADTVLAITNTSILDLSYTNTFDDPLTNGLTLMFWAKGAPGAWSWNPWVSKHGEVEGWQFRTGGAPAPGGLPVPCWTMQHWIGPLPGQDKDDLFATIGVDNNWHHYAGLYDATLGLCKLYVDGTLRGETNDGPFILASDAYIVIGGRDDGFGSFDGFYPGNLYDVRIYNYPVVQSAVRNIGGFKPTLSVTRSGSNAVMSWDYGMLLGATNIAGPWTPVSTAPPYMNSMTDPRHFFRVSNP